jgi:hypothetical protein
MGANPRQSGGFRLDGPLEAGDVMYVTAAAVTILKGDALHDNGSGLVTNATTAFAATFMGIAGADCASGGNCMVIRPNPKLAFWVPNASGTVAAATHVGTSVDLENCDDIDVTDNTLVEWGFRIVEIDISALALAANAGGYVKGYFEKQPQ